MKTDKKRILFVKSLRTGFLAACFLIAACMLTGCAQKDKLLSELSREDAPVKDETVKMEDAKEAVPDTVQQGAGAENAPNEKRKEDAKKVESLAEAKNIYVHVCGAVNSPGVYELQEGSRFYEAVEMAGGFADGASQDYLNMAALLADGSRLEIPTQKEIAERNEAAKKGGEQEEYSYYTIPSTSLTEAETVKAASDGLVNINTADIAGLCALPGIGEGRAKAIIEYREKQGGFQKKEDIMQVSGIGEKMYARMEAYLTTE